LGHWDSFRQLRENNNEIENVLGTDTEVDMFENLIDAQFLGNFCGK
jgi:hypothetical protein